MRKRILLLPRRNDICTQVGESTKSRSINYQSKVQISLCSHLIDILFCCYLLKVENSRIQRKLMTSNNVVFLSWTFFLVYQQMVSRKLHSLPENFCRSISFFFKSAAIKSSTSPPSTVILFGFKRSIPLLIETSFSNSFNPGGEL